MVLDFLIPDVFLRGKYAAKGFLVHLLSAQKRGHPLKDRSSEKHLFL
jgi:hypothetical protein